MNPPAISPFNDLAVKLFPLISPFLYEIIPLKLVAIKFSYAKFLISMVVLASIQFDIIALLSPLPLPSPLERFPKVITSEKFV